MCGAPPPCGIAGAAARGAAGAGACARAPIGGPPPLRAALGWVMWGVARSIRGERSVARCRRAADPSRRAVDGQPGGETLMRLPVAAPVGAALIPGTSRIVARPVRGQRERHDGNVDLVDIVGQIDVAIAVEIFEILRRHPATIIRPTHVAPGGGFETPVDVDTGAAGNAVDRRKAFTRPRP